MAKSPVDGKAYFFVDKCLPFGSSISCAHFQAFSDAVAHIVTYFSRKRNVNYLDDFFFAALLRAMCNAQVDLFLRICSEINFPVSLEKTYRATTYLVFLGLLIDTVRQLICIPVEKIEKALAMIKFVKTKRKITLDQLQRLCGFLNFLCKAIVPGRAFTRRLYAHTAKIKKAHHHLRVTEEMKADITVWEKFLHHPSAYCRPFMDVESWNADEIDMYSDASGNFRLGFGAICGSSYICRKWDVFTRCVNPSIEYLELYAVTAAVLSWLKWFKNRRIILFCDNNSVVYMLNSQSSRCKNCMILIRMITMESLLQNTRVFAKHVRTEDNPGADALSRLNWSKFVNTMHKQDKEIDENETKVPEAIWPISKIWVK